MLGICFLRMSAMFGLMARSLLLPSGGQRYISAALNHLYYSIDILCAYQSTLTQYVNRDEYNVSQILVVKSILYTHRDIIEASCHRMVLHWLNHHTVLLKWAYELSSIRHSQENMLLLAILKLKYATHFC